MVFNLAEFMSFILIRKDNDQGIERDLFNFEVNAYLASDSTLKFKIKFDNPQLISLDRHNIDYIRA